MAKQFSADSFAERRAHRAKKGTSIGSGVTKRSSMSKAQKSAYKSYRGQGR